MVHCSVRTRLGFEPIHTWLGRRRESCDSSPSSLSEGLILVFDLCFSVDLLLSIWEIFIENSSELGIVLHDKENSHRTEVSAA